MPLRVGAARGGRRGPLRAVDAEWATGAAGARPGDREKEKRSAVSMNMCTGNKSTETSDPVWAFALHKTQSNAFIT